MSSILKPAYSFSTRQLHVIVIFRLKSISDLDSQIAWRIQVRKIKNHGAVTTTGIEMAKTAITGG